MTTANTTITHQTVRALGLCSGGLDSMLSALVLRRQGIHVEWISFETPFFSADKARRAANQTGIPLHVQDITDEYLVMLQAPPAGFGKNMNPCMDCHALMFRKAGFFMQAHGFDFLFSGEVLGQRPMSQTAPSLRYVEKHSGFDGKILRPLSARRLPETDMERQGLVDRNRLLDLSGRSRKPQMALAAEFGIGAYPSPAGGCLLTDPG
jgi:tRNA U34 2-thiouridine synthase MnmA/TrmU